MSFNWTNGLFSGYGLYDQLDRLSNITDQAVEGSQALAYQARQDTQFKPFTVTTPQSTVNMGADGSYDLQYDDRTQGLMSQLMGNAEDAYTRAGMDTSAREADVYERMRAVQRPEEQRAQDSMDSRLTAQGRSGVRSAAYGGTPEQLAYHKAVEEAKNSASLSSIQQAQNERMQDARLGGMFQTAGYMPQANALNSLNPALQAANMGQAGQIAGGNLAAQLGLGGLQSAINSEGIRAGLFNNIINGTAQSFGDSDPLKDILGGLWARLQGAAKWH